MAKTYEYDLPFVAHTPEIGTLYQYLLEAYASTDYDSVEEYGRRLIQAMKDDVLARSEPTEEEELQAKAERDRQNAIDMALERR